MPNQNKNQISSKWVEISYQSYGCDHNSKRDGYITSKCEGRGLAPPLELADSHRHNHRSILFCVSNIRRRGTIVRRRTIEGIVERSRSCVVELMGRRRSHRVWSIRLGLGSAIVRITRGVLFGISARRMGSGVGISAIACLLISSWKGTGVAALERVSIRRRSSVIASRRSNRNALLVGVSSWRRECVVLILLSTIIGTISFTRAHWRLLERKLLLKIDWDLLSWSLRDSLNESTQDTRVKINVTRNVNCEECAPLEI
jgi:hypothetical protein